MVDSHSKVAIVFLLMASLRLVRTGGGVWVKDATCNGNTVIPMACFARPGGILQDNIVAIVGDLSVDALVLWHSTTSTYDALDTISFQKQARVCETSFDHWALYSDCVLRIGRQDQIRARVIAVAPGDYCGYRADEGNIIFWREARTKHLAIMLPDSIRSIGK